MNIWIPPMGIPVPSPDSRKRAAHLTIAIRQDHPIDPADPIPHL
jgi:hypothetical protein